MFRGSRYENSSRPCNWTWLNERPVEISIIQDVVGSHSEWSSVLDVGNALSHYFACNHGIIDLGEVEQGVVNVDIMEFEGLPGGTT